MPIGLCSNGIALIFPATVTASIAALENFAFWAPMTSPTSAATPFETKSSIVLALTQNTSGPLPLANAVVSFVPFV
jgi:hypothetical protein